MFKELGFDGSGWVEFETRVSGSVACLTELMGGYLHLFLHYCPSRATKLQAEFECLI